jgi:hypothetical protein
MLNRWRFSDSFWENVAMSSDAAEGGALSEAIVFLYYFKDLNDPRQQGKVQYPLNEVLLLCLLAILAGAETIADIARFGEKKLTLLWRFSNSQYDAGSCGCAAH